MSAQSPTPLSLARGLGPTSAAKLATMGIHTVDDLRAADAFDVHLRLQQGGSSVDRNLLYALIGAQENRDWREVARTDKTSILLRLEQMSLL
jgi:DNA transformation protein and related proteins